MSGRVLTLLAILAAAPAHAQRAPDQRAPDQRGSCPVAIAFEIVGVQSVLGISRHLHGVVLVGSEAFEGNPAGRFPDWGRLVARQRDLRREPLKDGHVQRPAGLAAGPCSEVLQRARRAVAEVNQARLPYGPAPELRWNTVNSNSFAHFLVRRLGLPPPPAPPPALHGFAPGYSAGIAD